MIASAQKLVSCQWWEWFPGASEVSVILFGHTQVGVTEAWTGPKETNTSSKTLHTLKEQWGKKPEILELHETN